MIGMILMASYLGSLEFVKHMKRNRVQNLDDIWFSLCTEGSKISICCEVRMKSLVRLDMDYC